MYEERKMKNEKEKNVHKRNDEMKTTLDKYYIIYNKCYKDITFQQDMFFLFLKLYDIEIVYIMNGLFFSLLSSSFSIFFFIISYF